MVRSYCTTTSRTTGRTLRLVFSFVLLFLSLTAASMSAYGQEVPTETDRPSRVKVNRVRPPRTPRPPVSPGARTGAMEESENFLNLGDRFYDLGKWNAAEAAYEEAIDAWSGNADALVSLGYLHVNRNKLSEAQAVYARLRSLNASYASQLQIEITRRKTQR